MTEKFLEGHMSRLVLPKITNLEIKKSHYVLTSEGLKRRKVFAHLSFGLGGSLAHGGVTSAVKATSSWELDEDWSERCGGRSGGRSSSMITVSS